MSKKILIINEGFEPSQAFIDEYVNIPEALPNLLTNVLMDFDSDIDTKRIRVYEMHPHLEEDDEEESEVTLNLLKQGKKTEANNYQVDLAVDFVKRHPQFKPMVDGVDTATSSFIKQVIASIREAFLGEF